MIAPSSARSSSGVVPLRPGWSGSFSECAPRRSPSGCVTVPALRGMNTATMPLVGGAGAGAITGNIAPLAAARGNRARRSRGSARRSGSSRLRGNR